MGDDQVRTDASFGVVAYRRRGDVREFLLVQHHAGHWAFPKGHAEADETPIDTARRELAEETGLTSIDVRERPAFEEHYRFTKKAGQVVDKTVTYYLAEVSADAEVTVQAEEIAAYQWGDSQRTMARLTFAEGHALLDEVLTFLDGS